MKFRTLLITALALILSTAAHTAALAQSASESPLFQSAEEDIKKWKMAEASRKADEMLRTADTDARKLEAWYMKAIVEFYKGDYEKAGEYAAKVLENSENEDKGKGFIGFIAHAVKNRPEWKEAVSDNFVIRYAHPKDLVVAELGKEVLEKSRYEIGLDLETYPDEPVIVEIYPDLESFTLASTLPPENVETTGVVGICKFNRIMILSPRLLPKGYTWADTLAHEYTHYLIFLKSENTVPVWLHEGIAKFEESRWREEKRNVLTPFYETILADALKRDDLVPIEKMHPSLAMLDSAREAQLAFAQAGTSVGFLVDRWGNDGLVSLLDSMRKRDDYESAIEEVTGLGFGDFMTSWRADLEDKNLREKIPGMQVKGVKIKKGSEEEPDGSEDLVDIADKKARDHTRLGDLLGERGRLKAAVYEYGKALTFDPASLVISTRMASALSRQGEQEKALAAIEPLLNLYPDEIDVNITLGRIFLAKGNMSRAEESFTTALYVNPFDPYVHSALKTIYEAEGRKEEAEMHGRMLTTLGYQEQRNE